MRLIDADMLTDFIYNTTSENDWLVSQFNASYIYSLIDEAPTVDAVPVVRCGSCVHGVIDACTNRLLCARCGEVRPNGHVWGGSSTMQDNFCSYGERRDSE